MNRLLDILMREGAGRSATSPASRLAASVPHAHEVWATCEPETGGRSVGPIFDVCRCGAERVDEDAPWYGPAPVTGYDDGAAWALLLVSPLSPCDGCSRLRPDVRAVGRDGEGAADAPDLCPECREALKEGARGQ